MSLRKFTPLILAAVITMSCGLGPRLIGTPTEAAQVIVVTEAPPIATQPPAATFTPAPTATPEPTATESSQATAEPVILEMEVGSYPLLSVELDQLPPGGFDDYVNTSGGYFLHLNFDCGTQDTLTEIYLNTDGMMGITFNTQEGFPNISINDDNGETLAISIGDDTLGFPVGQYDTHTWILKFMDADPITITYPFGTTPTKPVETAAPQAETQPPAELRGWVAFASPIDGDDNIYTIEYGSFHTDQLTDDPGLDYEPAWSPDGQMIVFVSERDGNGEIFVMNRDGSDQTNLTLNDAYDGGPAWSPDGTTIAFYSERDGDYELYLMDPDGSNVRQVTDNSAGDSYPSWSADSQKLVFHSNEDDDNWDIYVVNADGSGRDRYTSSSDKEFLPAWSPDGTKILYWKQKNDEWNLYVMDADGQNQTQVTTDNYLIDDWISRPAWAPEGFAFAAAIEYGSYQQIMIFPGWGVDWEFFTTSGADSYDPAWWAGDR